jgi:hypothetical protein
LAGDLLQRIDDGEREMQRRQAKVAEGEKEAPALERRFAKSAAEALKAGDALKASLAKADAGRAAHLEREALEPLRKLVNRQTNSPRGRSLFEPTSAPTSTVRSLFNPEGDGPEVSEEAKEEARDLQRQALNEKNPAEARRLNEAAQALWSGQRQAGGQDGQGASQTAQEGSQEGAQPDYVVRDANGAIDGDATHANVFGEAFTPDQSREFASTARQFDQQVQKAEDAEGFLAEQEEQVFRRIYQGDDKAMAAAIADVDEAINKFMKRPEVVRQYLNERGYLANPQMHSAIVGMARQKLGKE